MLAIQEECKRLYPIGCTYRSVKEKQVYELKQDTVVYRISGNNIYAHNLGGCLYMNGEYAEIILEMKPTMQDIQEECKRRFPIGCIYIRKGFSSQDKLKLDSSTYRIVDDGIYAHCGGGYLYIDGQYSKLISVEAKLDRVLTASDFHISTTSSSSSVIGTTALGSIHSVTSPPAGYISGLTSTSDAAIKFYEHTGIITSPSIEIHTPIGITHQEAIITKRVRKSNKLIIK